MLAADLPSWTLLKAMFVFAPTNRTQQPETTRTNQQGRILSDLFTLISTVSSNDEKLQTVGNLPCVSSF